MRLRLSLRKKRETEGERRLTPVSELLSSSAKVVDRNPHGILYLNEKLDYLLLRDHPVWGGYAPLFASQKVEEVWLFQDRAVATVKSVGRVKVGLPENDNIEDLFTRLVAETGVPLSMRIPRVVTEYAGWRLAMQIPPGGQLFLAGQRIQTVPDLTRLVDPLLAARLLLLYLRPSLAVVIGPPGSGKSTLLNSLLVKAAELFPHLHISLVEKYKELVVEGGWATRLVSDLADGVRYSMRYLRPDALFVGEISSEDAWTVIEPGRSGVPTMTTYHSPSLGKALSSLTDALRLHLGPSVSEKTVLGYIDVFVLAEKTVTLQGVERRVGAVYVSDGQRLLPLFMENRHIPEEDFEKMLPDKLIVGETARVKNKVYNALGVGALNRYTIEHLEPLLVA